MTHASSVNWPLPPVIPTEASLRAQRRDLGRWYCEPRSLDFTRTLVPLGMTVGSRRRLVSLSLTHAVSLRLSGGPRLRTLRMTGQAGGILMAPSRLPRLRAGCHCDRRDMATVAQPL